MADHALDTASTDAPVAAPSAGSSPFDIITDAGTTGALADVQARKVAETERFTASEDRALAEDRTRAVNFLDRESVGPDDLKKWDVKHERDKYRTDPIETFGSVASVFAIAASAFTKAPMENALNGAAAAMNAAREGNEKEYDKAYTAWKDNNELVIKRHNLMHSNYTDALSLMSHDVQLGDAKIRQIAARYGDQQALTLLEHGYAPQLIEMIQARAQAATTMQKVMEHSDEYSLRNAAFQADIKQNPNMKPDEKMSKFEFYMGAKTDLNREWMRQYWAANPSIGDSKTDFDNFNAAWRKHNEAKYPFRGQPGAGTKAALVNTLTPEVQQDHPDWTPGQVSVEANRLAEAAVTKRTGTSATQETVDQKAAEYKKDGLSDADAQIKAQRFVKLASAVPSGNRIDQLRSRVDQIKYATERIDEVEKMLKRHKVITGLGGKVIGRPTEIMSNILGSNSTDYKQFQRTVEELQQLLPRILTDSQGRPLSTEAGHVSQIVAGLNPGDTLQGTVRAYGELKKQLAEMSVDTFRRIRGGAEDTTTPAETKPRQTGGSRWQDAPVVP